MHYFRLQAAIKQARTMTINRISMLLVFIAAVGLTGCQADEAADSVANDVAATNGFTFEGDFDGPLGLQLWSLREYTQDDLRGALQRVYDMGFREVELAGTYGHTPAEFRTILEEIGLAATSMHASYELLRDSLDAVLDDAETLGVTYVGVAWIPHPGDQPFDEEMARETAQDFNRFGEAAA